MLVLDDNYMRDSIEKMSFKYGGKIKVLGYITNRISDSSNEKTNVNTISIISNQVNIIMLPFLGKSELNIVHPIAIYYE